MLDMPESLPGTNTLSYFGSAQVRKKLECLLLTKSRSQVALSEHILLDQPEKNLQGTNTLAYFAAASMTKKKKFHEIFTRWRG
jgi:hypothetical protein